MDRIGVVAHLKKQLDFDKIDNRVAQNSGSSLGSSVAHDLHCFPQWSEWIWAELLVNLAQSLIQGWQAFNRIRQAAQDILSWVQKWKNWTHGSKYKRKSLELWTSPDAAPWCPGRKNYEKQERSLSPLKNQHPWSRSFWLFLLLLYSLFLHFDEVYWKAAPRCPAGKK